MINMFRLLGEPIEIDMLEALRKMLPKVSRGIKRKTELR